MSFLVRGLRGMSFSSTAPRRERRARRRAGVALLVASAVALAACASSDKKSSTASSAGNVSATSTANSTPGSTTPPTAGSTPGSTPGSTTPPTEGSTPGSTTPPTEGSTPGTDAPVEGGTLTILHQAEALTLDPTKAPIVITSTRSDGFAQFAIFGALVLQDPSTGDLQMSMADSMTSTDNSTWTLKLRPNLTFSDSTPFDAAAVKFNWERHGAADSVSAAKSQMSLIKSMDVVDNVTLKVTLTQPNAQWPRVVALYPMNFIASPAGLAAGAETPAGAGPFVLKEWLRDDHMTLVRNPSYFDAARPYLDEVVIKPIPDSTQRLNSLVVGQGQMAYNSADFQAIANAQSKGFGIYETSIGGGQTFLLNTKRAPFNDVRVRRAMMLGLNLDQLNEVAQRGHANLVKTLVPENSPFYDPAISFPKYDPVEAQRLIDEVVAETGKPISFTIVINVPNKLLGDTMQSLLSVYKNVNITIETVESPGARVAAGDYDMSVFGVFFGDPEPQLYDYFLSSSGRNVTGYSNADVDAALKEARAATSDEDRVKPYAVVQQHLIDDAPMLWLWRLRAVLMYDKNSIHNITSFGDGVPRLDLLWLSS
jgi:peptide/nickel transport system substrate-binding protein